MKRFMALISVVTAILAIGAADAGAQAKKDPKKPTVKILKEGSGFDGIRVGRSTADDVIKKFGKSYKLVKHKKYSAQMIFPGGISFYYCQSERKKTIFDIELRAPFAGKTAKGITLSKSTLEDVYRIYGKSKDGLEYRGVSFYYAKFKGKNVVTVIDIVEPNGIRQCSEAK